MTEAQALEVLALLRETGAQADRNGRALLALTKAVTDVIGPEKAAEVLLCLVDPCKVKP